MVPSAVIFISLFIGISTSIPVGGDNPFVYGTYYQHPLSYNRPAQDRKTPASTTPIKKPPILVRSSSPTSNSNNYIPVALSDPSFVNSPEYTALLQETYARLQATVPGAGVPLQTLAETDPAFAASPEYKGFLQDVYARLQDLYDAFLERRDALLNLIYCTNCTGNHTAWQTFMNALSRIPSLGWVSRPSVQLGKPGVSFLVATNENGVVTGVGGIYINNQPVVQYTFNSTHMTPVKPAKPVKPVKLLPGAEDNDNGEQILSAIINNKYY